MTALPKDYRLKKRSDFSNLYRSGASAFKTQHFTFLVKPNSFENSRLGVVVRKKIFKQAVYRNYIRRVTNSLFISQKQTLISSDIIAILTKPIELNFKIIKHEWDMFFEKVTLREQ